MIGDVRLPAECSGVRYGIYGDIALHRGQVELLRPNENHDMGIRVLRWYILCILMCMRWALNY